MIAAIDLGGTRTKWGLVDKGRELCSSSCAADAQGSLDEHLTGVLGGVRDLCKTHGMALDQCEGLGLLSTGLVNNRAMRVISTNGKYDEAVDFDFVAWARSHAGLELRMENDARAALLGEWRYGAGRGVDNLMMMTIGTGIGTAVISEGRLLTGPHFTSGNLGGHLIVRSGGRACTCGGIGCLESEASGWVLPQLIEAHPLGATSPLHGMENLGYRELLELADSGDPCASEVFAHCLRYWGEALVSFIHAFDPERIVIGGGLMNASERVLPEFRKTIDRLAWAENGQVEVVKADHPDNAGLIGASALFY